MSVSSGRAQRVKPWGWGKTGLRGSGSSGRRHCDSQRDAGHFAGTCFGTCFSTASYLFTLTVCKKVNELLMALVKVLLHMKWKGYYHWQWGRTKMDLVSSTLGCKLHAAALFLRAMSLRDHNLFEHVEMHLASSTIQWIGVGSLAAKSKLPVLRAYFVELRLWTHRIGAGVVAWNRSV